MRWFGHVANSNVNNSHKISGNKSWREKDHLGDLDTSERIILK